MFGNVVNSVPRPAIVTLLTIAAGLPVPVVIASTSATMVMVRCVVALAANVPTSTVILSGFVAVVSEAEAGIVLDHLGSCLSDDFDVNHSTFQLETPEHVAWEARTVQPRH